MSLQCNISAYAWLPIGRAHRLLNGSLTKLWLAWLFNNCVFCVVRSSCICWELDESSLACSCCLCNTGRCPWPPESMEAECVNLHLVTEVSATFCTDDEAGWLRVVGVGYLDEVAWDVEWCNLVLSFCLWKLRITWERAMLLEQGSLYWTLFVVLMNSSLRNFDASCCSFPAFALLESAEEIASSCIPSAVSLVVNTVFLDPQAYFLNCTAGL